MLGDDFEDVCVVRADRHDHGAVHVSDRREETFCPAERSASRFESSDLDPWGVLKDLQFRKVWARDLQVQRALVRFEPELLPELLLVAFLAHVEGAFAEAPATVPEIVSVSFCSKTRW